MNKISKAEFRAKVKANAIANIEAKKRWRLQANTIANMKARSTKARFGKPHPGRPHRLIYPFTMAIPPFPGSRSTSDLDSSKVLELYKRLNGLVPDPDVHTDLGLGPHKEMQ